MTLYGFNALDEAEKHEAIWEYGVMVGERIEEDDTVILYQIFSFNVELYHHRELNVLRRLRSFSSTKCLDVYIEDFSLNSLKM